MESVRAPFEFVSASFRRSQKQLSSEMKEIVAVLDELRENRRMGEGVEEEYKAVEKRLSHLVDVLNDADVVEKRQLSRIGARFREYQLSPGKVPSIANTSTHQHRSLFDISERRELALIGDFLLRRGYLDVVDTLIEESGQWLDNLLDVQIYKRAVAVEQSVLQGELDAALQWVQDHASKLRRLNSALEFFVRQEQFLTLVYTGQSLEALRFAQTYLAPLVTDKPFPSSNTDKTPPSTLEKRERRSSSLLSDGSDDSPIPMMSFSSPPRQLPPPQRQRAVSLGAGSAAAISTRRFSTYRHRATATSGPGTSHSSTIHATPPRHPGSSSSSNNNENSLPISLPFSFSANPLAFFRYSRRPSQSHTRERSSSGNFVDFLSGDPTFTAPPVLGSSVNGSNNSVDDNGYNASGIEQEQNAYIKEAMCHLMSMLAFMGKSDNDEKAGVYEQASKKSKSSSDTSSSETSLFGSMVPCLYESMYTPHRRRCIVDLFRVEFRRVYCITHVSPLEHYVKLGVFALKTPSCSSPSARKASTDSPHVSMKAKSGNGSGVINALRYVREGIRTVRNRARTSSSGSSSGAATSPNSSGLEEMDVEEVAQIDDRETLSTAGRTPPPRIAESNGKKSINIESFGNGCSSPTGNSEKQVDHSQQCPVCTSSGQVISATIPVYAARSESVLVCRGSGQIMNHDNPPVALPNGQVFSREFVMKNAKPKTEKTVAFIEQNNSKKSKLSTAKSQQNNNVAPKSDNTQHTARNISTSIFGGCYCGGGVNVQSDESSPRVSADSSVSDCVQNETRDEKLDDNEVVDVKKNGRVCNGDHVCQKRPLTAIETMIRLRRSPKVHNGIGNCIRVHSSLIDEPEIEDAEDNRENMSVSPTSLSSPLYFTCPVTGITVDISQLKSVFIV